MEVRPNRTLRIALSGWSPVLLWMALLAGGLRAQTGPGADAAARHYLEDLALVEGFVKRFPGQRSLLEVQARVHFRAGKFETARTAFEEALRLHPAHGDFLLGLGACLTRLGRHDEAVEVYRRALALEDPRLKSLARRSLILALDAAGKIEEEIRLLREDLERGVRSPSLHYQLARALETLARTPGNESRAPELEREALTHYDACLKGMPDHAEALYARGQLRRRTGDVEGGRKDLLAFRRRSAEIRALDAGGLLDQDAQYRSGTRRELARALVTLGETGAAREQLEAALELGVDLGAVRLELAALLTRLGKSGEARKVLETILASEPTHVEALRRLAELHLAGGEVTRARDRFIEALKARPDDPDLVERLARLAVEGALFRENVNSLTRRALELRGSLENLELRLEYLLREGQDARARALLEQGLRRFPRQPRLIELRERLEGGAR